MPKGPKGEKRPAKIATGEEAEKFEGPREKSAAATELGRIGGRKRAEAMSAERRAEIARKAAESRWKKG
jgi:hypothetical protein